MVRWVLFVSSAGIGLEDLCLAVARVGGVFSCSAEKLAVEAWAYLFLSLLSVLLSSFQHVYAFTCAIVSHDSGLCTMPINVPFLCEHESAATIHHGWDVFGSRPNLHIYLTITTNTITLS